MKNEDIVIKENIERNIRYIEVHTINRIVGIHWGKKTNKRGDCYGHRLHLLID